MRTLVYIEVESLDVLDEVLGTAVDDNAVEKYAVLTVDGAPILYEQGQDSAPEYLSAMALSCLGITEI